MKVEIEIRDFPFFRLSTQQDLVLSLIKKELLAMKFIQELDRLGFDSSLFTIDLSDLIISFMGFTERGDKFWNHYYELASSFAKKVDLEVPESASEQALELYLVLREKL